MYKIFFLIYLILLPNFVQSQRKSQVKKINEKIHKPNPDVLIDELCVGSKEGVQQKIHPNSNSKEINFIPYQTIVEIYKYTKDENIDSRFVKIKFNNQFGWVNAEDLKWDCHEHIVKNQKKINASDIVGFYYQYENNEEYSLALSDQNIYFVTFFGGCDEGGCFSSFQWGKWKIENNYLFLKPDKYNSWNPSAYMYEFTDDGNLTFFDLEHSLKENYNNDAIFGWKKKKPR